MLPIRRCFLFFFLLFFFSALPLSALPAEAGVATLYRGDDALGQIPAKNGPRELVVSVADAGALLGFDAAVAGEELHLSRGSDKLRVVLDAVAAWDNNLLIPLYGASYVENGKWWLDVPSLVSLLKRFAGNSRFRIEEGAVAGTAAVNPPVPDKAPPAVSAPPSPSSSSNANPPNAQPDRVVVVTEPVKTPVVTPPKPSETQALPAAAVSSPPAAPGVNVNEVLRLRWSTSREKIRAVADCVDGVNPAMKVESGKILVTFNGALNGLEGVPSPYENVKVDLIKGTNTTTLAFAASGVRVEKLVLDEPRRIVLDFIFNSATVVREVAPPEPAGVPAIPAPVSPARGKLLVVLDPGHGGRDPGAVGNGLKEKDINLAVGLKLEKTLKAKGLDVKMTRRTDVYLKLQERTDIANNANADMFVSIHVNALPPGKNSRGFEIYLMAMPTDKDALNLAKFENREYLEDKAGNNPASDRRTELLMQILGDMQQNHKITESTAVAERLLSAGNNRELPMKRVAQAPFFVLRGAGMPAVLLEMGFITNANEAKLLAHSGYQQRIAEAMADGINNYLK